MPLSPRSVRRRALIVRLLTAGTWLGLLVGRARAAESDAGYDARPLLSSLRPALVANLNSTLAGRPLESLPLYDLALSLQSAGTAFDVAETLYFTNNGEGALPDLVLRIYGNAGRAKGRELVHWLDAACVDQPCSVQPQTPTAWRIAFRTPLPPRRRVRVRLHLRGQLEVVPANRMTLTAQSLEGLSALAGSAGPDSYGLLAVGGEIRSFANFYAVLATRQGERWLTADSSTMGDLGSDELANVRASVSVPSGWRIAHGGSVLETSTTLDADGAGRHRQVLKIGAALVRDFSLVLAHDFESANRDVSGIELTSYFRPDARAAGEHVLDVASNAIRDYERHFATYPYSRLDIAEAPLVGGAGGVEFSGLATVASVFYGNSGSTPLERLLARFSGGADVAGTIREFITAHEVAHQWWHVLVGSDSREHPFSDEGLAQYSTLLYYEDRYGPARAAREAELNLKLPYQMMRLSGQADAPVERSVATFATPLSYSGLVYGKGPFVYREVRRLIGDAAFFQGLHDYAQRFAFRIAPARAVFAQFSYPDRARLSDLIGHWLDQTNGDTDLGSFDAASFAKGLLSQVAPTLGATPATPSLPALNSGVDPKLTRQLLDALRKLSPGAGL